MATIKLFAAYPGFVSVLGWGKGGVSFHIAGWTGLAGRKELILFTVLRHNTCGVLQ